MIAFSTPYYLSGKQARSWHTNKGEKALMTSALAGGVAYGLTRPKWQGLSNVVVGLKTGGTIEPSGFEAASKLAGVVAGTAATYGVYHYTRAALKNRELKQPGRKELKRNNIKNITGNKTEEAFHSARRAHGNI